METCSSNPPMLIGHGFAANPGDWLVPDGGVDELTTLHKLRRAAQELRSAGSPHSYLIVHDKEVVGLCGYKHPPRLDGHVEIGFGIATSRRNRGHATRAVALLIEHARHDHGVGTVVAETRVDNVASQGVLRRNGFTMSAKRRDAEEGELIIWTIPVSAPMNALRRSHKP